MDFYIVLLFLFVYFYKQICLFCNFQKIQNMCWIQNKLESALQILGVMGEIMRSLMNHEP